MGPVPHCTGLCPCQSQSPTFPWARTPFCILNFHSIYPTSPPILCSLLNFTRRVRSFLCLTWSVLGKARLTIPTKAVSRPQTPRSHAPTPSRCETSRLSTYTTISGLSRQSSVSNVSLPSSLARTAYRSTSARITTSPSNAVMD